MFLINTTFYFRSSSRRNGDSQNTIVTTLKDWRRRSVSYLTVLAFNIFLTTELWSAGKRFKRSNLTFKLLAEIRTSRDIRFLYELQEKNSISQINNRKTKIKEFFLLLCFRIYVELIKIYKSPWIFYFYNENIFFERLLKLHKCNFHSPRWDYFHSDLN